MGVLKGAKRKTFVPNALVQQVHMLGLQRLEPNLTDHRLEVALDNLAVTQQRGLADYTGFMPQPGLEPIAHGLPAGSLRAWGGFEEFLEGGINPCQAAGVRLEQMNFQANRMIEGVAKGDGVGFFMGLECTSWEGERGGASTYTVAFIKMQEV